MKSISVLIAIIFSAIALGAFAKDRSAGLSDAQYEHALRNISTAPNYYVLVWVVEKNKGKTEKKQVCVEAMDLLHDIQIQHNFPKKGNQWEAAIQFALAQKNRTYEFPDTKAPEVRYTQKMLDEVRTFLADRTEKEIDELVADQKSSLYKLCDKEPGSLPRYFPAVGHVLCERGILCGRSCKPGLIFIDNWKENKTSAPGNVSTDKAPGK